MKFEWFELVNFALLCSALLCFTLLYFALLCFTLLYSALSGHAVHLSIYLPCISLLLALIVNSRISESNRYKKRLSVYGIPPRVISERFYVILTKWGQQGVALKVNRSSKHEMPKRTVSLTILR